MDIDAPLSLLGGLSPAAFMRRHWQKKPLLVRQAIPGVRAPLPRSALFALAERDDVESRLIQQHDAGWSLRRGPIPRRALPPLARPGWTLLVQGLDLHLDEAHSLMQRFRFVPDARLDDLMISYATDGGGVGPHFDSYDVFLLQVHGRRRWRIGRLPDPQLVPDVPLKILANFRAEQEWVLEPGDMLYLPPRWAHDGVAEGECMTCSVGFRSASRGEFARETLQRLLDGAAEDEDERLYRDPSQPATSTPAALPEAMQQFAREAVARLLYEPDGIERALGEWLTEPKSEVWFEANEAHGRATALRLDRRTRMMYDARHVYINGESFRAAGRDATIVRRLADARRLAPREVARLSDAARALIDDWVAAGWVHTEDDEETRG